MSHKRAKQTRRAQRKATSTQDAYPRAPWHSMPDDWKPCLQAAVPLRQLSLYERGGITRQDLICAYLAMEHVGGIWDRYARGVMKIDEKAKIFNQVARAIAVLSYLPGGVPFHDDQGPYDAENFLAGIIGQPAAHAHVTEALHRTFGEAPVSQEPLRELAAQLLPKDSHHFPQRRFIGYLTESNFPPSPTDLAAALVIYLAVDQFCVSWKRHALKIQPEQEVAALAHDLFSRASDKDQLPAGPAAGSQTTGDALETCSELLRDREVMVHSFLSCYKQLGTMSTQSPGKISVLLSFTQSPEQIRRAIFQHLILLIQCGQLFMIERDIPESQDYQEVIDIIFHLLSSFSYEIGEKGSTL
jgi:hypothetical protein